jgi:hypothetical protein
MLVMFMVDQLKIEYLRNERYSFFIWFFFGLVIAIGGAARRELRDAAAGAIPAPETRPQHRFEAPAAVAARPAVLQGTR